MEKTLKEEEEDKNEQTSLKEEDQEKELEGDVFEKDERKDLGIDDETGDKEDVGAEVMEEQEEEEEEWKTMRSGGPDTP